MVGRKVLVCWLVAVGALLLGVLPAGANVALPGDDPGDPGGGGGGGGQPVDIDWQPRLEAVGGGGFPLLPQVTPMTAAARKHGPAGLWRGADCANDFCLPNISLLQAPYCMDPERLPNDTMYLAGVNIGHIGRSCYQLLLTIAFQASTGVDPDPVEFTLQQLQRNIHQQCNEQFAYISAKKYACYAASGVVKNKARALVQASYGRVAVPGFNLGPETGGVAASPNPFPLPYKPAGQYSHAFIATCRPGGASPCGAVSAGQTFGPGSRLSLTGVVRPNRKILYTFVDPSILPNDGQVLDWWITAEARDNGVVHHEREELYLDRIRRGQVRVVATYLRWENNQTVTTPIADIDLVAGGTGGGGGGGGDDCDLLAAGGLTKAMAVAPGCDPLS